MPAHNKHSANVSHMKESKVPSLLQNSDPRDFTGEECHVIRIWTENVLSTLPKRLGPSVGREMRTGCSFEVAKARDLIWTLSVNLDLVDRARGAGSKGRIPSAVVLFFNSFFHHVPASGVGEERKSLCTTWDGWCQVLSEERSLDSRSQRKECRPIPMQSAPYSL